jgi:type IV pilus assembly protein PilO
MAMKTGLEGKPWYFGAGIGVAIGAVIFGLAHWRLIQPIKDEIARGEATLAELQTKIQEGRAAKQQLPKFREEVRQLELELDKLLRILPARRNTPDLLRRIRSLAEQGDFALKRFTPKELHDKEFFSEWPIEVSIDGSYHNLALFFDRISRFSRIINIENLQISAISNPNSPHTITAGFNAKTFVYKEPEPAAPATPGAPGAAPPPADSPAARALSGPPTGEGI